MLLSTSIDPPFFFFNDTATTEIYTLSLHDALPISASTVLTGPASWFARTSLSLRAMQPTPETHAIVQADQPARSRSEEHTSELQSHLNLVCRLLLEKKKRYQAHSIQQNRTSCSLGN